MIAGLGTGPRGGRPGRARLGFECGNDLDGRGRLELLHRYDIEIGGGLGALAGKCWRIGCMGHTARPRNVTLVLAALDELLA